jgi:hypothetical protein
LFALKLGVEIFRGLVVEGSDRTRKLQLFALNSSIVMQVCTGTT